MDYSFECNPSFSYISLLFSHIYIYIYIFVSIISKLWIIWFFNVCMDFVIFKDEISDIKNSKRPKNIKELDDSLFRNYWNKTKYIWLNNRGI